MIERQFPIMDGPSIPWAMIAPHEARAQSNHSQTLERLAQRGGLSVKEALCVLKDYSFRHDDPIWKMSAVAAEIELTRLVAVYSKLQAKTTEETP